MGIRKRFSVLLLAVLLSFGVCAVDYLKVDALEVGGSVVWDTAINYLLGLLGLSPIAENGDKIVDFDSMRSKWVQDYEAYFYANVQPEDLPEGYTKERAYQNWIDNVCRGNLNTIEYGAWDLFKEWAETLPSENSSGGSGGGSSVFSFSQFMNDGIVSYDNGFTYTYTTAKLDKITSDLSGLSLPSWFSYDVPIFYGTNADNTRYETCFYFLNPSFNYTFNSQNNSITCDEHNFDYVRVFCISGNASRPSSVLTSYPLTLSMYHTGSFYGVGFVEGVSSVPSSTDYAVVNDRITDLQIINDYSTTTTQNVVSIDWDKIGAMISDAVGSVTGSLDRTITDALDDAQEKVAAGTMSVANYNDYVTEISNTYVYDITNETSITNPESTVTGVITGNVENAEFVLKGLQYVFPFCIPWDIKDFVTLLVADPVAPIIEYPIYNPVTDTDEIITIDFSLWENQVRIIRYIFDFLLIIGLLLLARSLIGAGGSD